MNAKKLEELYNKLDYTFNNAKLLELALCHRSLGENSNERLEFLGDSILSFVITSELFNRYHKLTEGELSRLRSNLVNGEFLARLFQKLKINDYILLGFGEVKSGGKSRPSILADTFEAIIGAVFLDSNIDICRKQILHWYGNVLDNIDISFLKDAKTRLQELMQKYKMPLPNYNIISIDGLAHNQTFHVQCTIEKVDFIAESFDKTKRKAEQNSATIMLDYLQKHPIN